MTPFNWKKKQRVRTVKHAREHNPGTCYAWSCWDEKEN